MALALVKDLPVVRARPRARQFKIGRAQIRRNGQNLGEVYTIDDTQYNLVLNRDILLYFLRDAKPDDTLQIHGINVRYTTFQRRILANTRILSTTNWKPLYEEPDY